MSDEQHAHHVNYFIIFAILCGCTALSILFDVVEISNKIVLITLVLGVAMAKALFVMLFFMHLKFEGRWKYVLLLPTAILAIGLPLALLPDIGVHYYSLDAPQETQIRDALREIVANEQNDKSLNGVAKSDEQIAEELKTDYFVRLTPRRVAAFRAAMEIPDAADRLGKPVVKKTESPEKTKHPL